MKSEIAWAVRTTLGVTSTEEVSKETAKAKKKLSSPSARLKGVSKYNNSKTQSPEVPQAAIEIGISVALAVVIVLLFKLVLKKVTKR